MASLSIVLVNPPRDHVVHLEALKFVDLGEIASFPPIGLMYLAQALRQRNAGFKIHIIDAVAEGLSGPTLVEKVGKLAPQVIGITASLYTFYDVWKSAMDLKRALPDVCLAVGGPQMDLFPRETMAHACFDVGVAGDGEEVFSCVCEHILDGKEIDLQPGVFIRRRGQVVGDGMAVERDLDRVKMPAIDLINPSAYYSTVGQRGAVGTIVTSRGCPYRCTFCQVPRRPYRARSVRNIVEEIRTYLSLGVNDFFFFDDLFNLTKKRVVEFSEEVLRQELKIGWMFRGRTDQIDRETLRLARRAGCHTISVGIEDATEEGLRTIRKNINLSEAREAIRLMRQEGIVSSSNWIIGFPHHRSRDELRTLLKVACELDADYAQFSVLQCLPGSELYDQAVAEGGIDPNAWRNYVLSPVEVFSPPIWEKHLSKQELYDFYEYAYRHYYFRPWPILREISRVRNWSQIAIRLRALKRVFLD
jgi:radical SAM superfamily enzyme YgiQ (UPF0313 family)